MLTCSVDSLADEAITSPFLRREMFVMGGYPPVAEQTSMAFWSVPFNCRVSKGCSTEKKKECVLENILQYIIVPQR